MKSFTIAVALFMLAITTTPVYAAATTGEEIVTMSQAIAIATVCQLQPVAIRNATQYLVEYIVANIPAENVDKVAQITSDYVWAEQLRYRNSNLVTPENCRRFADGWVPLFTN